MSGSVTAPIAYVRDTGERPRYYANAHERDTIVLAPAPMPIEDMRGRSTSLDVEGCVLWPHRSGVADFADPEQIVQIHVAEVAALIREATGCDEVAVVPRGVLRFSEKSGKTGSTDNSHPARFAHVDVSAETGTEFRARTVPRGRTIDPRRAPARRPLAGGAATLPPRLAGEERTGRPRAQAGP